MTRHLSILRTSAARALRAGDHPVKLREAVTSLQAEVLPASFPTVPGLDTAALYRSASEVAQVGGDFYDLFALDGGRVAAVKSPPPAPPPPDRPNPPP